MSLWALTALPYLSFSISVPICNSPVIVPFFLSLQYLLFWTCLRPIFRSCFYPRKKYDMHISMNIFMAWHEMSFHTDFRMSGFFLPGSPAEGLLDTLCKAVLPQFILSHDFVFFSSSHSSLTNNNTNYFTHLLSTSLAFLSYTLHAEFKENCLIYPVPWNTVCTQ